MSGLLQTICVSVVAYLALTVKSSSGADPSPNTHVALDFARRVFHDLADNQGNATLTAAKYQTEFNAHDADTSGRFGQMLTGLFEMRVEDLRRTVEHTLAMQEVVHELVSAGGA